MTSFKASYVWFAYAKPEKGRDSIILKVDFYTLYKAQFKALSTSFKTNYTQKKFIYLQKHTTCDFSDFVCFTSSNSSIYQ